MDYLNSMFGGFAPHLDADAAVKFALNGILLDARFDDLENLLIEGNPLGGVQGEPGWILERRDSGDNMPGYVDWPDGAQFRAFVDPDFYELSHPEFYMDRKDFQRYVGAAMNAYLQEHPSAKDTVVSVLSRFE